MVRRAFPAEVTNGQLRFQESLADLEGRRVMVVLDECESPSKPMPRLTPSPLTVEELDVEQDVDFQRPFRWESLKAMYHEAADDDHELAEAGMADYARNIDNDVVFDAWCELPMPTPIGLVASRRVESLPFDIPHIPAEKDWA